MLGAEKMARHSFWFLRNCEKMLAEMRTVFPASGNIADTRNTLHMKWLKWAGFRFTKEHNIDGNIFIKHWRNKPQCAGQRLLLP